MKKMRADRQTRKQNENQAEYSGWLTDQMLSTEKYALLIVQETLSKTQTSYFLFNSRPSSICLSTCCHTTLHLRENSSHCTCKLKNTLEPLLNCHISFFTPLSASFHSSISMYLPSGVALAGTESFWGGSWWLSSGPSPSCCPVAWERWSSQGQTPSCHRHTHTDDWKAHSQLTQNLLKLELKVNYNT